MPNGLHSSTPIEVALFVAGSLIGAEAAGKLFVFAILFVAALAAFDAAPVADAGAKAAASTVYVLNPFVFGRLHYGQLFLLAAYAVFPWAASQLRSLLRDTSYRAALTTALGFALLGICSLHVLLMAGALAIVMFLSHVALDPNRRAYVRKAAAPVALSAVATLIANAPGIWSVVTGRGAEGAVIAGVTAGDVKAYAAVPDSTLGLVPNLLGLYGFWAETAGRFTSMKAFIPYWPAVLACLLAVCAIGAWSTVRKRSELTPWVVGLVAVGVIALVLEMGVSNPETGPVVRWLDDHFVAYRGMRDAGKWAAPLALIYSQLLAVGTVATLGWFRTHLRGAQQIEWAQSAAIALVLALSVYYGNGLLFGAHDEIKPSQYPAGWYAADRLLSADKSGARALFLPWNQYLSYSFIRNRNNVVASPAPTFFSIRILASQDPGVPGVAAPVTVDQQAVSNLLARGPDGEWSIVLKSLNVKYVLLAKEFGWDSYAYIESQRDLTKIADFGSILLFKNDLIGP